MTQQGGGKLIWEMKGYSIKGLNIALYLRKHDILVPLGVCINQAYITLLVCRLVLYFPECVKCSVPLISNTNLNIFSICIGHYS